MGKARKIVVLNKSKIMIPPLTPGVQKRTYKQEETNKCGY